MSERMNNDVNRTVCRSREPPEEPPKRKEQRAHVPPRLIQEVFYLLVKIAAICLVFILLFTLMFGVHRFGDASMSPAVKDGDLVFYYRLDQEYVSQDTLVVQFEGKIQVRRVVAVEGDHVDITNEGLIVNGAIQQEPGISSVTKRYENNVEFPLTVGKGQVFVLGDARVDAADSRVYGAVNAKDTLGKVITILRRRDI